MGRIRSLVVVFAFLIGSLVIGEESPGRYSITAVRNDGVVYSKIKSPSIASVSPHGEQYLYFLDSEGHARFVELCETEPECIGQNGLKLSRLSPGE